MTAKLTPEEEAIRDKKAELERRELGAGEAAKDDDGTVSRTMTEIGRFLLPVVGGGAIGGVIGNITGNATKPQLDRNAMIDVGPGLWGAQN
jgi:hypothetical protein